MFIFMKSADNIKLTKQREAKIDDFSENFQIQNSVKAQSIRSFTNLASDKIQNRLKKIKQKLFKINIYNMTIVQIETF